MAIAAAANADPARRPGLVGARGSGRRLIRCGRTAVSIIRVGEKSMPKAAGAANVRGARKMRIAFVVQIFPSLSETFILEEIVGAIRRGIDVDVFALERGAASDIHPLYAAHGLDQRTFYGVPADRGRIIRTLAALAATLQLMPRHARSILACARGGRQGVQARTFVSLARAFLTARRRYDLVHAHFGPNGIRAEVLRRAKLFDAPIVTTFHGYDATSFVVRNGPGVYADLARNGEAFIAVSESIARALRAIGIPESRTSVMPLGVDCSLFTPRAAMAPNETVRLVSVGRFVEKKGFEYGIAAVALARRSGARLRYDIVGDGPLRAKLAADVARLGLADAVVFAGSKDRTEIAALLAVADIMLVPSVTAADGDQEGLPVVVKEAMAMSLPVVGSRHAGIPEIVQPGITGLLANERDVAVLAEHLVTLAGDPAMRTRLGRAGRSLIEQKYENERLMDELVAMYRSVAARCAAARDGGSARFRRPATQSASGAARAVEWPSSDRPDV
jgi:colanic acid/amylovoran biosynthesis glycosyltransferase